MNELISILILSTLAGSATAFGGLVVLIRKPGKNLFSFLIGLAAGVMLTLSFVELVAKAWNSVGFFLTTIGFAFGSLFMFFLDFLLPHMRFSIKEEGLLDEKLFKAGMLIVIGVTIHNLPEGIVVGAGFMHLPSFGILIALAIALHNIPEGIATALPLYVSGVSRLKCIKFTFLSGMAEPIGAVIAFLFLQVFHQLIAVSLAFAAGVMVFITIDELIPMAQKEGHAMQTSLGIIFGTITMFLLSGIIGH